MKDNCISDHLNCVSFVHRTEEMENSDTAAEFLFTSLKSHCLTITTKEPMIFSSIWYLLRSKFNHNI